MIPVHGLDFFRPGAYSPHACRVINARRISLVVTYLTLNFPLKKMMGLPSALPTVLSSSFSFSLCLAFYYLLPFNPATPLIHFLYLYSHLFRILLLKPVLPVNFLFYPDENIHLIRWFFSLLSSLFSLLSSLFSLLFSMA